MLIRHGRNIKARQIRMRGTANGIRHGYKEERISVGYEDVSCCALLSFLLSLTMSDLLVKKQQSSPIFYSVSNHVRFIGKEKTILL
jgi:hypothetical protein